MNTRLLKILDYLASAEGLEIHRNAKERDITSMYGIYRFEHPTATIFKKIDRIALVLGISAPSQYWEDEDLQTINNYIGSHSILKSDLRKLASIFYQEFYQGAHLNLFPMDCVIAVTSMFTNSPLRAWKSIQFAINCFSTNNLVKNNILVVDGIYGSNTEVALKNIYIFCHNNKYTGLLFEADMLLNMSSEYSLLIKQNPDKYIRYSTGWDNRLKKLIKYR